MDMVYILPVILFFFFFLAWPLLPKFDISPFGGKSIQLSRSQTKVTTQRTNSVSKIDKNYIISNSTFYTT